MKTSHKLLIALAGILVTVIVVSLASVRDDLQALLAAKEAGISYSRLPVESFERLEFSGKWKVKVRQGDSQKVEVAAGLPEEARRGIVVSNNTLSFRLDSTARETDTLYVKITTPTITYLRASGGAEINIWNFKADSVSMVLEDNARLMGDNNQFEFSNYRVSGNAVLQFADYPDL